MLPQQDETTRNAPNKSWQVMPTPDWLIHHHLQYCKLGPQNRKWKNKSDSELSDWMWPVIFTNPCLTLPNCPFPKPKGPPGQRRALRASVETPVADTAQRQPGSHPRDPGSALRLSCRPHRGLVGRGMQHSWGNGAKMRAKACGQLAKEYGK